MTIEAPGQRTFGGEVPEFRWTNQDDECNCVFQRIGDWTNPYIGRTLRVRMCCIWSDLYKQYPQFVQEIPGYWNANEQRFEEEPMEWNGEFDMPESIWFRHLAVTTGRDLDDVRENFKDLPVPKGVKRPPRMEARKAMSEHEIIGRLTVENSALQEQVDTVVSVIHAIKNGEIDLDRIELHDNGFTVKELEEADV